MSLTKIFIRLFLITMLMMIAMLGQSTISWSTLSVEQVKAASSSQNTNDDDDDDDDDNDDLEFEGVIESYPTDLIGTWQISGETFIANDETEFEQEEGVFAIGVRVEVEYTVQTDGRRLADKIETEDSIDDDQDNDGDIEFKGKIDTLPATSDLTGTWVVDGVSYTVNATTVFDDALSDFTVGRCVEIEYSDGTPRLAKEIDAEDDDDCLEFGLIQSITSSRSSQGVTTSIWVIGNVAYVVTDTTTQDTSSSPLTVGEYAQVDSYVGSDGRLTARSLTGVVPQRLFLPIVFR